MLIYYIMIVTAAVLVALQFIFGKLYNKVAGCDLLQTMKFNTVNGIVCGTLFFALNGFAIHINGFSLVMSFVMSVLFTLIGICNVYVVALGEMSVYSMFSMLGLMISPFLFGMIFLQEEVRVWKTTGSILLVISLILPIVFEGKGKNKHKISFYVWCVIVFLINGAIAIVSKFHQIDARAAGTYDFISVMYYFSTIESIACYAIMMIVKKKRSRMGTETSEDGTKKKSIGIIFLLNFAYAIVAGTGYLLQLFGATKLDASVLYPIVTGGTVVLSTLFAWLIYKEKPNKAVTAGIVITAIATAMFMF